MGMQPETRFKNVCRKDLELLPGIWILKTNERSVRGIPDFLICLNAFFVAIELKVGQNKADRLQQYHLAKIASAGGISLISYPETWEDDYKFLKQLAAAPISSYRSKITKEILDYAGIPK